MKCKYCLSENIDFIETPELVHYGKYMCARCKRFLEWVKNPNTKKRNKTSHKDVGEVSEFHKMKIPVCFFCLRRKEQLGEKETLTLDHIQELNNGGEDAIFNLQILCSACHKLKNWSRLYVNWHLNGKNGDTKTA